MSAYQPAACFLAHLLSRYKRWRGPDPGPGPRWSETLASPRKPGAFGCLRTHLFGCICRYSLLVLYLRLHLPLSSLVMMHSAKENRHLRGLCFSFRRLELSACQPYHSCQPSGCLPAYLLTCLLAVSANTDCVHIIYYHSLLIFDFTASW
jgi:hypothetical protein